MPLDFSRIIQKSRKTRIVRVLKDLRKPFALWPIITAFAKPFRTRNLHTLGRLQLVPGLKKPLPAWSLLIILLLGAGIGFYASAKFSQVAGFGQSTAPDFTLGANPASITAPQSSLASFTVSLASLNSFAGSVNLNYSLSPRITNATIALNPSSVSLLTGPEAQHFQCLS